MTSKLTSNRPPQPPPASRLKTAEVLAAQVERAVTHARGAAGFASTVSPPMGLVVGSRAAQMYSDAEKARNALIDARQAIFSNARLRLTELGEPMKLTSDNGIPPMVRRAEHPVNASVFAKVRIADRATRDAHEEAQRNPETDETIAAIDKAIEAWNAVFKL